MAKRAAAKKTKVETVLAWHFVNDTLRDGRAVPPDGEWLIHEGECEMCETGLHASRRLIDALQYAPGPTVCRVAIRGIANEHENDKLVARERMILWRLTASDDVLRGFARKAALSVIDLWEAPAIVRQYLETGDENLKSAAESAAESAARSAAESAARSAAGSAAESAKFEEFNALLEQMVTEAAGNPDTAKLLEAA